MFIPASSHPSHGRPAKLTLFATCALTVTLVSSLGYAEQSRPSGSSTRQSAKVESRFAEAETLIQQGLFDQAKEKLHEQLKLSPSVEGYNLLGIVYGNEK